MKLGTEIFILVVFLNLKKGLGQKRFAGNEEVDVAIDDYLQDLSDSYFNQGIDIVVFYRDKFTPNKSFHCFFF